MKETVKETMDEGKVLRYERIRDEVTSAGKNAWFAGLGVIATAEKEATTLFDKLVERGKNFDTREKSFLGDAADEMVKTVKAAGKKLETGVQKGVVSTLHRVGMPSNEELQTLISRVEELTRRVQAAKPVK